MARILSRLGASSARHPWLVVVAWIVILAGSVTTFLLAGGTLTSTISIPGTAAQQVADDLEDSFPDASGGTGTIVFASSDGEELGEAEQEAIGSALERVAEVEGVEGVVNPFDVAEQRAAQEQQLAGGREQAAAGEEQLEQQQSALDAARGQLEAAGLPATDPAIQQLAEQQALLDAGRTQVEEGLAQVADGERLLSTAEGVRTLSEDGATAIATVRFDLPRSEVLPETKEAVMDAAEAKEIPGVEVAFASDLAQEVPNPFGPAEVVGLIVAAIVLFVMLGTLVAAGLPLVGALVGVGVAATATLAAASVVEMSSVTPTLGLMIGLAVGIDYALFIVNRHRRQLRERMPVRESIALATGTSGNAVLFAGLTVIIALLALNLTGIGFLALMGNVGAVFVAIAVLVALTLTPALLSLLGERVLRRREKAAAPATAASDPTPSRSVAVRHPLITLAVGVLGLLIVAIPATSMRLGLPNGSTEPAGSTQYESYTAIDEGFGAGANGAITVVAAVPATDGDAASIAQQADIAERLIAVEDVAAAAPAAVSDDGRTILFQVVPAEGPSTESTEQVVRDLRALSSELDDDLGVTLGVTGLTASNIDISATLADALPIYLIVVLGLCIILMTIVFRSIAVPLMATAGFLLSILAALGAVVAVFQWGWLGPVFGIERPGPILSFVPTILVGVVFGLAMDYQLFLASAMREAYVHGRDATAAVVEGLRASRPVIVAAAIIMIAVFGGFAFSESTLIRPFGFGLAIGVLADAFVVRLLLIPAAMTLLGRRTWWVPRWLDRALPDVDVEGASLERTREPALAR